MSPRVLAAGFIPVFRKNNQWLFLILRCYKYWDFPKGEIDGDEELLTAAIRELEEETTLTSPRLLTREFYETEPYSKNKVATYFLGEVSSQTVKMLPNPENGIIEHHEYRWLAYQEARTLLNPRLQGVIDWAQTKLEKNES